MEALSISDKIAILNDGKVQQFGTPYEIYNKPVNLFIADFIGRVNMLKGIVLDSYTLSTGLGNIVSKEAIPYDKEAKVKFIVRPEDIVLRDNGSFIGTIIKLNYQGPIYDTLVEADALLSDPIYIRIIVPGSMSIKSGDRLSFDISVKSKHHIFDAIN